MHKRILFTITAFLLAFGMVFTLMGSPVMSAEEADGDMDRIIEDMDIQLAVETELALRDSIPAHYVDVEVVDGVATLSGTVANGLAKEQAAEAAAGVKGVKAVVNLIEVAPGGGLSDSMVERNVETALLMDPATESFEIGVDVEDGVAVLAGVVDSQQERRLAGRLAGGVKGVKQVQNDITVVTPDERKDEEIHADVASRLKWDSLVDDALIKVQVENGVVRLTGSVGSVTEKNRAEYGAWVAGVKGVDVSDLEVDWARRDDMRRDFAAGAVADADIDRAVRESLAADPRVNAFEPDVSVEDGVVTLTGAVTDLRAKRAAAEDARNTYGVWKVRNHLRVRPEERPADVAVMADVRQTLKRHAAIDADAVNVVVENGRVSLYGEVDSRFERLRAEDLASAVEGVAVVRNNLDIQRNAIQMSDWELRQDIYDQLFWSPFVDSDEVQVKVTDGAVTLTGTVESWNERAAATENAREAGAVTVLNKIRVEDAPGDLF